MATILIVDDETLMREFLATVFEQDGHRVLLALHGQEALDLLGDHAVRPDLVISDVMMPWLSGVELCRMLKSDPRTSDIPIVLMTGAGARANADAGADAVIDKPFDLEVLDAIVRRLLALPSGFPAC